MGISKEKKAEIFKTFGGKASNTGSVEGQIALFTERINFISKHLNDNKKDHSSRRSLIKMVGMRRRYLRYLAKGDINKYRKLIEKLNIRK